MCLGCSFKKTCAHEMVHDLEHQPDLPIIKIVGENKDTALVSRRPACDPQAEFRSFDCVSVENLSNHLQKMGYQTPDVAPA